MVYGVSLCGARTVLSVYCILPGVREEKNMGVPML